MSNWNGFASWIAANPAATADLIFACAVAIAAIVGIRLNLQLVKETAHLRRAETEPTIAVYIEMPRLRAFALDMVISNSGRGAAHDITFSVAPNNPIWKADDRRLTDMAAFRNGVSFMAPSQEIRFFFGTYMELVKEPITITVSYFGAPTDRTKTRFEGTFVIDASVFQGMGTLGVPPEETIANALDAMQKDLRNIRQGGSFSNISVTVRRHYFFSSWVNRQWFTFSWWWRNQRIRWQNGKHPWRSKWDRVQRVISRGSTEPN